jgi:hypothetical protein
MRQINPNHHRPLPILWEVPVMTCPDCEYHKQRAALWRAEAYKQAGHDVIERSWVGLTDEELGKVHNKLKTWLMGTYNIKDMYRVLEDKLREKNGG